MRSLGRILVVCGFLPLLGGCVAASLSYRHNGVSVEVSQAGEVIGVRVNVEN